MAQEKKLVEDITSMEVDFAQWYTDVVKKAQLADYSSVKGCMVIKPAGYAIWENIQNEFDTEQEYREAAADLKRIKGLVDKYNVDDPEQAKKILASIKAHPDTFRSPYGMKFVVRLERAAGITSAPPADKKPDKTTEKQERKAEKEKKKQEKRLAKLKEANAKDSQKEKFQIFTPRNFAIGVVIVACVVVFSVFAPRLFKLNNNGDSNGDIRRTMVTAYANSQAELKMQLYTYYFNVVGQTEEEAQKDAQEGLGHYVMDLSDRTVSTMTAGLSGNTGNGVEGETAVEAAINSMMDYQYRISQSLCYNYSLLGNSREEAQAYADEDMASMFGEVIYDYDMTIEDKQSYFDSFVKRGLIKDIPPKFLLCCPIWYNQRGLFPAP